LTQAEITTATHGTEATPADSGRAGELEESFFLPGATFDSPATITIPWRSTLLVPELAVEKERPAALASIARFARCSTGIIGYDCVPLSMSETAHEGMLAPFMRYLAACAYATRLAAISDTASLEFRSWRSTLASRGISGPDIETVELATEVPPAASFAEPAGQTEARGDRYAFFFEGSDVPLVVVVGSHEPRKNHMTVLHAAELLWRRGERFSVLFLGGNSWHSEPFFERVAELRSKGRMVDTVSAAPDHVVSSAYRAAACSVFVSLHEGFGLPIVESLACATPVITSSYGAMADNARHGGCLLVDPRDPQQVADALSRVLNQDDLRRKLSSEASTAPARTWDTYAEEAWDFLVHGRTPR
jgi:glycosyltransferase involved in cell wall biosynthesis